LSWNFHGCYLLETKLSVGFMDTKIEYYNLTIGNAKVLTNTDNFKPLNHSFCQVTYGYYYPIYSQSIAAGAGLAFYKQKMNLQSYPKISVTYGMGLLAAVDYILFKNNICLGFQSVLPIPFNKNYRDFGM
jgi:hypothetical protein